MTLRTVFQLRVRQVSHTCEFELFWEEGQTIFAELDYPDSLSSLYQKWHEVYVGYYKWLQGQRTNGSSVSHPYKDRRFLLVQAENHLLYEFHSWLRSKELYEIRAKIVSATERYAEQEQYWVDIFLNCTPWKLGRLPWETWKIGTDLEATGKIRFSHQLTNINNYPVSFIRRPVRILAIFEGDTGLNLEAEQKAMRSLPGIGTVEFVCWQPGKDEAQLQVEIDRALAAKRGWDILFFTGNNHELLKQAKKQGLKFAIFNLGRGIDVAQSLIDLGLNQMALMREPIPHRGALEFLKQFLKSLSEYKDVHEAVLDACEFLKQPENCLDYPSAHLVPSLFRHPEAKLFCIKPKGINRWFPTKLETLTLSTVLVFSLLWPVQDRLLNYRILAQAFYRQVTNQFDSPRVKPVLLVQIDEESRRAAPEEIKDIYPINYQYLSKLIDKISALYLKPNVIGMDYLLDRDNDQPSESSALGESVRKAVEKGTWFVFGAEENASTKTTVSPNIASLNWSMKGDLYFLPWYVELLPKSSDCSDSCPFAYLLALSHSLLQEEPLSPNLPKPKLNSQQDFRSLVTKFQDGQDRRTLFLQELRLLPISSFGQWFQPIIDFSLPPTKDVYEEISAAKILAGYEPPYINQQVVLIVPWKYKEAGLTGEEENNDNYPLPSAVAFWGENPGEEFPGGAAHAYMVHHLLTEHVVVPVPDFLIILVAAGLGKGVTLILRDNPRRQKQWVRRLGMATVVYCLVGLEIYISAKVLIPLLLPSAVFWNYIRLALRSKSHG